MSDGHTVEDLFGITIVKMQAFLSSDSIDETYLWEQCCYKVLYGDLPKPVHPEEPEAEYVQPTEVKEGDPHPSFIPPITARVPGQDTLADIDLELPKTDLVIKVEGETIFDETAKRKLTRAEIMEKARAARKVNKFIEKVNKKVNKK